MSEMSLCVEPVTTNSGKIGLIFPGLMNSGTIFGILQDSISVIVNVLFANFLKAKQNHLKIN